LKTDLITVHDMRKTLFAAFLGLAFSSFAQNPADNPGALPSIIPPSPDIASLNRIGNITTGLHTGSANVSIPLYDLTVGTIKHPLAINYSTNGIKVNDIASRVGLGWNLVAGGSVNRTVHDEEDDDPTMVDLTPPSFSQPNQATLDYLFYAPQEGYDTELDEYSFAVNGMSGKFYFDANGVPRIADHMNIKIAKPATNTFTITTAEGVVYTFGNGTAFEKTKEVKTNGNPRAHKVKRTAWFLTNITSPEGDWINFYYTSIPIETKLGPYQSVIFKTNSPTYPGTSVASCASLCSASWSPVQYNKIDYDTYYLHHIETSDYHYIDFLYEFRPDASGDKRLTGLDIFSENAPMRLIKKYIFEYDNYLVTGNLNQRFFLKKLSSEAVNGSGQRLSHLFEYNDPSTLGKQETLTQDYYGYSRADGNATPSGNFIPRPLDYTNYIDGFLGIDRTPVFQYAKAGALTKVIYPTGGYEAFEYEPHTLAQYSTVTDSVFSQLSVQGPGANSSSELTYTTQFTVASPNIRVKHITGWNTAGPPEGSGSYQVPDGIHFISYLEIWNLSTNQMVYEDRHKLYSTTDGFAQLQTGVTYELRLRVKSNSHWSQGILYYNPSIQTHNIVNNLPVCGIRVKNIRVYDPVSNRINTKYYTYAALIKPEASTGNGVVRPNFESLYQGGGVCWDEPTTIGDLLFQCPGGLLQVSSSSLSGSFTYNGSPVAYDTVMESDDPFFANGVTEHLFFTSFNPQQPFTLLGTAIAGASSTGPFPDDNGKELETKVYKKQGASFITLKKIVNSYVDGQGVGGQSSISYIVRKRWSPVTGSNYNYSHKASGYDVNSYIYLYKWRVLEKTDTYEYDENGQNEMKQTVEYEYSNPVHLQPTKITTTNSKGEKIRQQMKYPADFGAGVYPAMVTNNVISPLIETTTTNQVASNPVTTVSVVQTEYAAWTGGFYKPSTVKIQNGTGPLENRLYYYSYDNRANPLELSKDNGEHIAYLWNHKNMYAVAEVKNAASADIAYTSFEGDANGGWSISGTFATSNAMTGENTFSGTLTRSVNSGKTYLVTLWARDNNIPSVNSTSGTLLATHSIWKLYQWKITGASSVSVSGQIIDEVRLYPADAEMTTYTYIPHVGITSTCDINNRITYYSYDGFNRLSLVKDIDKNIVKKICYTYAGQAETCEPGLYYNTVQSGVFTTQCGANQAGNQVTYTVAANTYSSTISIADANQQAQANITANGQAYANANGICTPVCTNCTGNNKKCINGVCETGIWVCVSSVQSGRNWLCTYKYCFSDGTYSTYSETITNSSACTVLFCN
jgi:hypothetical protein